MADHRPRLSIRDQLAQRRPQGAPGGPTVPPPRPRDIYLQLGIDFGTRYTKVCWHDGQTGELINFSKGSFDLKSALLPSVVGVTQQGHLLTGRTETEWTSPSRPALRLEYPYLKMALAALYLPDQERSWALSSALELRDPATVRLLSAYFLSRVIRKSQAWVRQHAARRLAGLTPVWSVCVGVPVQYADSPARKGFLEVLRHAALLADQLEDQPPRTLLELRAESERLSRSGAKSALECEVYPEIAAALQPFVTSREAREQSYLFFDIGGGTLDGVAFKYERLGQGGAPTLNFYAGQVKPLGVNALAEAVAPGLKKPSGELEQFLMRSDVPREPLKGMEAWDDHIRLQVREVLRALKASDPRYFGPAELRHLSEADRRRREHLAKFEKQVPLFVGGGGQRSWFYKRAFKQARDEERHLDARFDPATRDQLPIPQGFAFNGIPERDFHRFSVAYGLSLPLGDRTDFTLPSHSPAPARDLQSPLPHSPYVSKDQV